MWIRVLLAFAVVLVASSREAAACMCVGSAEPKSDAQITREVKDELGKAVGVFTGRVVERDELTVTFEVDAVWKGEIGPTHIMSTGAVASPDGTISMTSCDFSFARGRSYLVFAFGKSLVEAKATSCTRTSEMRYALETLPVLDKLAERRRPR